MGKKSKTKKASKCVTPVTLVVPGSGAGSGGRGFGSRKGGRGRGRGCSWDIDDAFRARDRGDWYLAANIFLHLFRSSIEKYPEVGYCLLMEFSTCVRSTPAGVDFMRHDATLMQCAETVEFPMITRMNALISRADLQHRGANYSAEAVYRRRAIALAGKLPESERQKMMVFLTPQKNYDIRTGQCLDLLAYVEREDLAKIEPPNQTGVNLPAILNITPQPDQDRKAIMISRWTSTGGSQCDCCGKTAAELGLVVLPKCSRCRAAFFCSTRCQAQRWEDGHSAHCKPYGRFTIGDMVRIHGLVNRMDLNGKLVKILGAVRQEPHPRDLSPTENKKKLRLKVENAENANSFFTVSPRNIRHVRPLL